MKKDVIFLGHLGLGDHIIQQGIVNRLARRYKRVLIFCKHHNLASVRHMCDPNVNIIPLSGDTEVHRYMQQVENVDIISVGLYNESWEKFPTSETTFDRYFYEQAGVDFEVSYEVSFDSPDKQETSNKIMDLAAKCYAFCFVHDDRERGFEIDTSRISPCLKVVRPSIRAEKIFDYIPLIQNADEIHCIDSSFALMIDRMEVNCDKYIHRYVREDSFNPSYREDWKILQ